MFFALFSSGVIYVRKYWNENVSSSNKNSILKWLTKFTFQVSLWCSRLPCLHKDSKCYHISNHDGKCQADHEHHGQGAIEKPTATDGTERSQWLACADSCLGCCSQVTWTVGGYQQNCCTSSNTVVGEKSTHGPGYRFICVTSQKEYLLVNHIPSCRNIQTSTI